MESSSGIESGNKSVIRATVFGGNDTPIKKDAAPSKQLLKDDFFEMQKAGTVIEPPLDLLTLTMMEENSTELGLCVDAMEVNIEGFGGRLMLKDVPPETQETSAKEIEAERKQLRAFLLNINPTKTITKLRRMARRDLELCGNAYWEIIPTTGDQNKLAAIEYVAAHTVRIGKQDSEPTAMTKSVYDPQTGEQLSQTFWVNFRRYVQIRSGKTIYFKQYGDPRIIDRRDGKAYIDEAAALAAEVSKDHWASAVHHFSIHTARSPYGMPRYKGNLFSLFGSRAAEEINYNTFLNNNVPSLAILVSGNAMLTDGTIKRINEFANTVMKRSNNYSKFLILEAESASDGLSNAGSAKIEIERLKNEQHSDQLFQEYDKNNTEKLRRSFRLPPMFVAQGEDANRATAEVQRKIGEQQVFEPERRVMDEFITRLFTDMGFKFWEYRAYSQNVTNEDNLVDILSDVEKTGALTPNFARKILGDILNTEPEYYPDDVPFDPDVPFSLTMAEAVKNANLGGNPSTGALAPNQGQLPAEKALERIIPTGNPELLADVHEFISKKIAEYTAKGQS